MFAYAIVLILFLVSYVFVALLALISMYSCSTVELLTVVLSYAVVSPSSCCTLDLCCFSLPVIHIFALCAL